VSALLKRKCLSGGELDETGSELCPMATDEPGLAIAEAVSHPPASHRGGPGSNPGLVMWDFVMDKSGARAGFLLELRFPLPIYITSASPQSSSLSPEAGIIGQE
jgi:hypothetical protein